MKSSILFLMSLALLGPVLAAVFQHELHHRESLNTRIKRQGLPKEYASYKQRQLHGKFSNLKSTSGNVINSNDFEYYINVTIGTPPQLFTIAFDTTVAYMTISNLNCNCGTNKQFDPSKSSTYHKTNYSFSHGSSAGFYGQDIVGFGNPGRDQLIVPNALFGQIVSDPVFGDTSIMGFGFTAHNPDLDPPIVTAVKSGILDSPVVTIFLRREETSQIQNGGVITYGAIDTVNCDRNVIYEELANPTMFQVTVNKATSGSNEFSGKWLANVRSSGRMILGPDSVIDAFAKEVNAVYDNVDEVYIVNCNAKFSMNLTIGGTVYTLTEKQLILDYYDNTCAFQLNKFGLDEWNLGLPWFRTFCNILDYGNKRVGFSKIIT